MLLGIAFNQFFVDFSSHERDGLLFQVLRLGNAGSFPLRLNLLLRFLRTHHSPHRVEGIHIEGERIDLSFIIRNRRIRETIEGGKALYIVPHPLAIRMEDMCSIPMHHNTVLLIGVYIASYMVPFVDDKYFLSLLTRFLCEHSAEKACSDYEIIQVFHTLLL